MVRVLKFLVYFFFFIVMLYMTFPKTNAFYKVEELVSAYKVRLVPESMHERLFSLEVEHMSIVYEGVKAAELAQTEILFLGLYNNIDIEDVRLVGIVKNFMPSKIAFVHISYSLLHPLTIKAEAKGDFGAAKLSYSLQEKKVLVELQPSTLMQQQFQSSLRLFKKSKDGVYYYEKSL